MLRLDVDTRTRVIVLRSKGYSVSAIRRRLAEENILVSVVALYKLLKKAKELGTVDDRRRKCSSKFLPLNI